MCKFIRYTGQQKNTFFKKSSKWLHILECIGVPNTILPSDFPFAIQFSRDNVLKFQKFKIFIVSHFITQTNKKQFISKCFQIFNIFWSRIVSLTQCCLKIFPIKHCFTVIFCLNFENSKFSLFIYSF